MTDSDDDDYVLPSLSERIQASLKTSNMVKSAKTYDSESEESEFLQFSERIRNTPCPQVKLKFVDSSDGEETEFLKFSERVRNTPSSEVKFKLHLSSSGSESENSEFLKSADKIPGLQLSKLQKKKQPCEVSDSDSDEEFSNIITKMREINTPKPQYKKTSYFRKQPCEDSDSESDGEFSNFITKIREINTPQSQYKKQPCEDSDSESDGSNFITKFREINTPKSEYKKQPCGDSDSESDGKFSNFITKFREINTPKSEYKKQPCEDSDSESDGEFSNIMTKIRALKTPKSQNNYNKDSSSPLLSSVLKKQSIHNSSDFPGGQLIFKDTSSSFTDPQEEAKKEYASLFPRRSEDSVFCKERSFYTQTLFEFFNRKVFNYKLPKDMPLIWSGSLIKTAGFCYCKAKKGVYSCSIKLSSKLLTSFDRLQDTLLHEMCHAAVWVVNNQHDCHGPLWQLWASRCKLILPFIDCPTRCHSYEVPYRFWYHCPSCKWKRATCRRIKGLHHGAKCPRPTCQRPIILTVKN